MLYYYLFTTLILCEVCFRSHMMVIAATITTIAEFVSVDYLWNETNSLQYHEQLGSYQRKNNAVAGVKVDANGNIYATVPRWKSGVPATLNKVIMLADNKYALSPWPSWEFQTIGEAGKLQNCQSMTIDSQGNMWIIEVGRRNFFDSNTSHTVNGPAGFFIVNIETEELIQTYYFPEEVVSYNNSFINDIILDEDNGYAYFTNSYADGGIVIYNMNSQTSRMFTGLSTQRNTSYDFCADGTCYGTDSIGTTPSDGIALNADCSLLYYSPVQGQGLYMIDTSYLHDFTLTNDEIEDHVIFLGLKAGQSDGMLIIGDSLYFGSIKDSSLEMISNISQYNTNNSILETNSIILESSSALLHWIDTFAPNPSNPTGSMYITSNKLDLFFDLDMDFSGKSGSNFRIMKVDF